jgi:hypothetical protein
MFDAGKQVPRLQFKHRRKNISLFIISYRIIVILFRGMRCHFPDELGMGVTVALDR